MASNLSESATSNGRSPQKEHGMLVAIDGSGASQHALHWAAARTGRFGPIQPMTVWHCPWWAYSSLVPPPMEDFKNEATKQVAAAVESMSNVEVMAPIICEGRTGPALVEAGAAADLMVLGTRGRSGLKDAMLGSVSSYVVAHATTPVAVVPAQAPVGTEERKIVVGVDGSPNSFHALLWSIRNAPADATIDVVHSWVYPTAATPEVGLKPRVVYEDNARHTLDQMIDRANAALQPDERRRLVGWLEYGDARGVLNEHARTGDLLVIGARGRGGVAHLLLGSVTSALLHQPVTTTVVIPAFPGLR